MNHKVTNGSLDAGGVIFSYSAYGCKWTFSYLPAGSMTGGVEITSDDKSDGKETDSQNSFNLIKL